MGKFNIDIERYYQELEARGQYLKGIFSIQYPIYCIHTTILDITPDPLDGLDKIILKFLQSKPDFSHLQMGSLMGTSKLLVETRVNKMIRDELLMKEDDRYYPTKDGLEFLKNDNQVRQHKRSNDFYIDGITLKPLPRIFYTYYRSKLIDETEINYFTNSRGETKIKRPFGPDIVHTPPDKSYITESLINIDNTERENMGIPKGLKSIEDLSYSKQTFQLLVSVCEVDNTLIKEVLDGFAVNSASENISYYEHLKRNIRIFENELEDKIANLEFRVTLTKPSGKTSEAPKPIFTTNWSEIDKYKDSKNKCFSFSSEDLIKVLDDIFEIKNTTLENIINEDSKVEVNVSKKMLLGSSKKHKLINDLIRERDYRFGNLDNNVFIVYIYFKTDDEFVKNVISLKKIINTMNPSLINLKWLSEKCPQFLNNYREILVAAEELEILEQLDIEMHMLKLS